jgi:predicted DNA-binding antitoxin AbrB/MazE fold protein
MRTKAIYEDGVLNLMEKLDLPEKAKAVELATNMN